MGSGCKKTHLQDGLRPLSGDGALPPSRETTWKFLSIRWWRRGVGVGSRGASEKSGGPPWGPCEFRLRLLPPPSSRLARAQSPEASFNVILSETSLEKSSHSVLCVPGS